MLAITSCVPNGVAGRKAQNCNTECGYIAAAETAPDVKPVVNMLIIDDNSTDVSVLRRLLKRSSHDISITVVSNGAEALTLYRQFAVSSAEDVQGFPPQIVLLDIRMPIMDGFEFLHELEKLDLGGLLQSIYLLSSSNAVVDRVKASENALVTGYLVKPLTGERLQVLLDEL